MRDLVRENVIEHLGDDAAVLAIDEAARLGDVTLQIVRYWVAVDAVAGVPQALGPAEASRPGGRRHRGVQKNFPATLAGVAREQSLDLDAIEIWFADEARAGQKNGITRRSARRGTPKNELGLDHIESRSWRDWHHLTAKWQR